MKVTEVQDQVAQEVKVRAEELAKERVRTLTLRRRQLKAVYDRTKKMIVDADKEISEIKVEDFEARALNDVSADTNYFDAVHREMRGKMVEADWSGARAFRKLLGRF